MSEIDKLLKGLPCGKNFIFTDNHAEIFNRYN